MGLDLTDALQIRITIQHLVQSGLVDDDKAVAVKEELALEKAAKTKVMETPCTKWGDSSKPKSILGYMSNFQMIRITGG